MVISRWRSASWLAIAAAAGLSAASAFGQNYYYPDFQNSPMVAGGENTPALQVIESELKAINPSLTLVLPPPTGANPDDKTLATATANAINNAILAAPGNPAAQVDGLIKAAVEYRPKKASALAQAATLKVLASGATDKTSLVEAITTRAIAVDPRTGPTITTAIIQTLVANSAAADADDAAAAAVAASKELANKVIAAAIKATKKAPATDIKGIVTSIASEGTIAAIDAGAGYLVEEIAAAATLAAPGVTVGADFAFQAVLNAARGKGLNTVNDVVAMSAAAVTGTTGAAGAALIKSAVSAEYGSASAELAAATTAINVFGDVRAKADLSINPDSAGQALKAYIDAHPTESVAAATAGAVNGWIKSAPNTVAAGIQAVKDHSGNPSSFTDVITAGTRANPTVAAKIATAAVNQSELNAFDTGDAVKAVIAGARPELVGAITLAGVKALNSFTEPLVTNMIAKAVQQAELSGYDNTIGVIAYSAAKASKLSTLAATATIAAANVAADPAKAGAAVAGAIAADKKNAGAIATAAANAFPSTDKTLVTMAANLASGIMLTPKNFYNLTTDALAAAGSDADLIRSVIYASTIANPKGANAVAAAAVTAAAAANLSIDDKAVIAAATGANFKAARNIEFAVKAAVHLRDKGDADLLDYVANEVFVNPAYVIDIVTGATVAKPGAAHRIAHAVGFRAPAAAGKAVPALFGFSQLDTKVTDKPAAAAAIMAGLADGIIEAKLVSSKEVTALKAAVSAAVKASLLLTGPNIDTYVAGGGPSQQLPSVGPAGVITGYVTDVSTPGMPDIDSLTVGAVLTAAVKAAKIHALAIAQAAAEAAAYVSGNPSFTGSNIVAAVMASGLPLNPIDVQGAVAFGIQQAKDGKPGAGAMGVSASTTVLYSHKPFTGDFVTSIHNL